MFAASCMQEYHHIYKKPSCLCDDRHTPVDFDVLRYFIVTLYASYSITRTSTPTYTGID